ncbi:MAG: hypothetical protein WBO23_07735 [Burkholderiales bacterium]
MQEHQVVFAQGVLLACAVSFGMTGCENSLESTGAPVAKTTVGTEIDDSVVTARVKSALLSDPAVKSLDSIKK